MVVQKFTLSFLENSQQYHQQQNYEGHRMVPEIFYFEVVCK
jgi:hypothetical protein